MEQKQENPLLATLKVRIPGETFRLPSQGLFYTNNELDPDVVNGELHVFPMTAIDEIILKTPDKLLSGKGIEEVFSRCIPQIKKPRDLLSKDVDYLLVCLRMISYGDEIDVTYQHLCENAKLHTYSTELRPLVVKSRAIDPTSIGSLFTLNLSTNQIVRLKPPLYGSVMDLYLLNLESNKQEMSVRESQEKLLNIVADTIIDVDGVTNREHIREWIKAVPAGVMRQIGEAMEKIGDWGLSTVIHTKCKDCGEDISIEIPLNPIAFFS